MSRMRANPCRRQVPRLRQASHDVPAQMGPAVAHRHHRSRRDVGPKRRRDRPHRQEASARRRAEGLSQPLVSGAMRPIARAVPLAAAVLLWFSRSIYRATSRPHSLGLAGTSITRRKRIRSCSPTRARWPPSTPAWRDRREAGLLEGRGPEQGTASRPHCSRPEPLIPESDGMKCRTGQNPGPAIAVFRLQYADPGSRPPRRSSIS